MFDKIRIALDRFVYSGSTGMSLGGETSITRKRDEGKKEGWEDEGWNKIERFGPV